MIQILPVQPDAVRLLRQQHLQEMNCQIILYSWLSRGWADCYLLRLDDQTVGYGLVGGHPVRDNLMEFYVLPEYRGAALPLFRDLVRVSKPRMIETQTNDLLLSLMLYDCALDIQSNAVLFEDRLTTNLTIPNGKFRQVTPADQDQLVAQKLDLDAKWMIHTGDAIAAVGGVLFHYNPPYGDIFMETAEPLRRRGYGACMIQELKCVCREMGKIPAARCNAQNVASRATLQRAGMLPCGRVLTGTLSY